VRGSDLTEGARSRVTPTALDQQGEPVTTTRNSPSARTTSEPDSTPGDQPDALDQLAAEMTGVTTVVLDTSVLMADPDAHLSFGNAHVVLPLTVIEELDRNKSRDDDAGRNARAVIRSVEGIRLANHGDIAAPVELPSGGTLRIEMNGLRLAELERHHLDTSVADHRIIAAALGLASDGRDVHLVSNDGAMRVKAAVLGLRASEHAPSRATTPARHGWTTVNVSHATIQTIKDDGGARIDSLAEAELFSELLENEFAIFAGTA
jgi:PhoH-like ATPase